MLKKLILSLLLTLMLMSTLIPVGGLCMVDEPAAIPGDVNHDKKVDIVDVAIVAVAFGSKPFNQKWNDDADINGDGLINIYDIAIVADHFGESGVDREEGVLAGWRSSPYGFQQEAEPVYWTDAAKYLASKISNSVPSGVWILGEASGRQCCLTFPSPEPYSNIAFSKTDQNERYLDTFDSAGLKVWLQVEPADADVETLIDLVLGRYQHHSCVIGFGVDVEWLEAEDYSDGRRVTNEEAQRWLDKTKSYDPSYKLFLKHWFVEKMPTSYGADVVFVSDSQEYPDMYALVDNLKQWGRHFASQEVCFQIGYASDEDWWSTLSDPFQTISNTLCSLIPNCNGVYWVDFTLLTIYPPS